MIGCGLLLAVRTSSLTRISCVRTVGLLSPCCATSYNRRTYSINARMAGALLRGHAVDFFQTVVTSVLPQAMVTNALKRDGNRLTVADHKYTLQHNVYIVAFGKAVIGMVRAAEDVLGDHIVGGIASVPWGIQDSMKSLGKWDLLPVANSKVRLIEGGMYNLPDENSHRAATEIFHLLQSLSETDLVLTLISGGGSALLPSPIPPVSVRELLEVTQMLAHHGATIQQLNTVRKHLELLKGGGLAKEAYPSQVIALLISDVVGNDLGFISSGPTVPDFTTPQQCLDLLDTLGCMDAAPQSVVELLRNKSHLPEFKKDIVGTGENIDLEQVVQKNQPSFHCSNVQNLIIGSNEIALEAAARAARDAGYNAFVLSSEIVGDAEQVGDTFARLAEYVCRKLRAGRSADKLLAAAEIELVRRGIEKTTITGLRRVIEESSHAGRPICILAAGETTVNVRGKGTGGRCQQMALAAAIHMSRLLGGDSNLEHDFGVAFLAAGTDGQDGPTDAAGALADPGLVARAAKAGVGDAATFLANNDAYSFFANTEKGRNLLKTGLTGTNVMDLHVLLVSECRTSSSAY